MRAPLFLALTVGLGLASASMLTPNLGAQDVEMLGRRNGVRPPPGYYDFIARNPDAYQFKTALVPWANEIRERRRQAMEAMDLNYLNAHHTRSGPSRAAAGASAAAVTGTVRVPSLLFRFSNTTNASLPTATDLETKLYSSPTPPTYSATTYYGEISRGLMTLDGDVFGPFTVSMTDAFYEGSCNGLPGSCGDEDMGALLVEVLDAAEAAGVDFSPYDFDSDGQVDFVAFLHPEIGGECGTTNVWAHRFVLSSGSVAGSAYTTDDAVSIDDYIIQSAVGGASGCADSTAVMPIGTFSHETGHAFGLPDLYDTGGSSDGIGHWGLMGSGGWNIQESPAHMSAWSLLELGWIAVDTIQPASGVTPLTMRPIIDSDTAVVICTAALPADCLSEEYFLLENRAARGADASVKVPAADGAGLLIWHTDPTLISVRSPSNTVNAASPPGLGLEQADGLNQLHTSVGTRGDTGDPWPGLTGATTFGPSTTPDSDFNDGSATSILIDDITVQADSSITLTAVLGVSTLITTNREGAANVIADADTAMSPYEVFWGVGSMHTIAIPDTQVVPAGNVRYLFESWADIAPPTNSHSVTTVDATPDTFTATLNMQHLLDVTASAGGTVSADIGGAVTLPHWSDTTDVAVITATEGATGNFDAFIGDTTTTDNPLTLNMDRPWSVQASFMTPVVVTTAPLDDAIMGAAYTDTLGASGGNGSFVWSVTSTLPAGLALDSLTGEISGVAEEMGDFAVVAKASSVGINLSREAEDTVQLSVGAPTLVQSDVVDQLIGEGTALSAEDLRFLDLLGNDNGGFDVGDFRAYLQFNGQLSTQVAVKGGADKAPPSAASKAAEAGEPAGKHDSGKPAKGSPEEGI